VTIRSVTTSAIPAPTGGILNAKDAAFVPGKERGFGNFSLEGARRAAPSWDFDETYAFGGRIMGQTGNFNWTLLVWNRLQDFPLANPYTIGEYALRYVSAGILGSITGNYKDPSFSNADKYSSITLYHHRRYRDDRVGMAASYHLDLNGSMNSVRRLMNHPPVQPVISTDGQGKIFLVSQSSAATGSACLIL